MTIEIKKIEILLILILCLPLVLADSIEEEWNATIPLRFRVLDSIYSTEQTKEGLEIISELEGDTSFKSDLVILEIDLDGNIESKRKMNGVFDDIRPQTVKKTSDGGYITTTQSFVNQTFNEEQFILLKTDSNGTQEWNKTFDSKTDWILTYETFETIDNGFFIFGGIDNYSNGVSTSFIIKTDARGNEEWIRTYDAVRAGEEWLSTYDGPSKLVYDAYEALNGGFILAGETVLEEKSFNWIEKIDLDGNIVQYKSLEGILDGGAIWSALETKDENLVIVGDKSVNEKSDIEVIKLDSDGNLNWTSSFGGIDEDVPTMVKETKDKGYIIAGKTKSFGEGEWDALFIKVDENGKILWNITIGSTENDEPFFIEQLTEKNIIHKIINYLTGVQKYIVAGTTKSEYWLIGLKEKKFPIVGLLLSIAILFTLGFLIFRKLYPR